MAAFWASFNDVDNMFGESYEAQTDFDPFPDQSDTDRTGLDSDAENLEDADPFEPDDEAAEEFENLDDDDVEVGEALNEDRINEVDLDFDPDLIEPDWSPDDGREGPEQNPTDISHEDETTDTQRRDSSAFDQWEETSPYDEISQDDDTMEDDDISQLEETGYDESLFFDDPDDLDPDLSDNIDVEIQLSDEQIEQSDIEEMIDWMGQFLTDSAAWVETEPPIDFTMQDVSSFHEVSEGYQLPDQYDPEYPDWLADDMLELGNIVDDIFADLFEGADMGDPSFAWFDSFL